MMRGGVARLISFAALATVLTVWGIGIACAPALDAQAADAPLVRTSLVQSGRTVGDPITVTVTITYDPALTLTLPVDPAPLGDLEPATPAVTRHDSLPDGRMLLLIEYHTRAFQTGSLTLQPPAVRYHGRDGVERSLLPPSATLEIDSVLPLGADAATLPPQPLKPALRIDGGAAPLWPFVAAVVGVGALLVVVVALQRRRERRPAALPAVLVPSAADQAALALERIAARELRSDELPRYCTQISGTIREYLQRAYRLPATGLTTRELPIRLARAGVDARTTRLVASLCRECDAVAFAGARPTPDRVARYLDLALEIVRPVAGPQWARPAAESGAR